MDTLSLPRWLQYSPSSHIEIHRFRYASEIAYAATVYTRIQNPNNKVYTYLLAAKTRVAPIKNISLPRLELCGAVLLSRLAVSVILNLSIENLSTDFWTDSTIVLGWLRNPPCSWTTFVANSGKCRN